MCFSIEARGAFTRSMSVMGQMLSLCAQGRKISTIEDTDIRSLSPARLDEAPELVTVDVSFIF